MAQFEDNFPLTDNSTPVVLFIMYHHIGMGIVRSLGRLGITVHAVEPNRWAPGLYSKYLTGRKFYWDVEHEPADRTVRFLQEVGESIGRRSILIPTTDELTMFVADHASELRQWFIFADQNPALCHALADKKEMYFLARKHRIPTPAASFPRNVDDVREFARSAAFPIMLKGIDGNRLDLRMGKKMFIVHNADELLSMYSLAEDPDHPNLMLQEYIPGGEDSVWMFNGYFNERSECLFGITGRKIRQAPVYTGYTSLGICLANHQVAENTVRFMREVNYRGILDIGYRFDIRDGQYKVLDVNPRIGATFRLFVAANGMDVVRALYRDLTGQPVPESPAVEGRKWFVEERDIVSTMRYLRDRKLTIRTWVESLRGVKEAAWFAQDDLKPFIVMATRFLLTPFLRYRILRKRRREIAPARSKKINRFKKMATPFMKKRIKSREAKPKTA